MKKLIFLLLLFAVTAFQPCIGQEDYIEKGLKAISLDVLKAYFQNLTLLKTEQSFILYY